MVKSVWRGAVWLLVICLAAVSGLQGGPPGTYGLRDPVDCTVAEVALSMTRNPITAQLGDTVTFNTRLNNTGPGNCSLTGMAITLTTPDGVPHAVASNLDVPAGTTTPWYSVTYVVAAADVQNNRVTATASASGFSRSNPDPGTDDPASGSQSITVGVTPEVSILTICTQGETAATELQLHVTGTTQNAPPGSDLTVTAGNVTAWTTTFADGAWSLDLPWSQPGGLYSLTATVSYGTGNTGGAGDRVEIRTVQIGGGEAATTHDTTPVIAGLSDAAAGTTVTVTIGGNSESTTVAADGSWTLDWPHALSHGPHTVSAALTGAPGICAADTQSLQVTNEVPVALDDGYAVAEDETLDEPAPGVLQNDTDGDGDPLTAVLVSGPAHGTLTLNADGSFSYTPGTDFNGMDNFQYKASDGASESAAATVTIGVRPVNDPPETNEDEYSAEEDTLLTVPVPGVLENDSDPDGDPLTAALVSPASNGTVTLNPDGSFTYMPNPDFFGDDSFTYRASDGTEESVPTTVYIAVAPMPDLPTAVDDEYEVEEDGVLDRDPSGVLRNDINPGGPLEAALVTEPANGTLTLNSDGSFTYTPNPNFHGTDTFTYRAVNDSGPSAPATVTITVHPVNDGPAAANDGYTTDENTALTISAPGVLANDTDADAGAGLSTVLVTGPANGSLALNSDGSFTYTPATGFVGTDSFTYMAVDGTSESNVATVTITVNRIYIPPPVNNAPYAIHDAYTADEDGVLTVPARGVLLNDGDPDGHWITAQLFSGPAHGTLALAADGSFVYTPNPLFHGTDTFKYRVSDGALVSNVANVTITVRHVNHAPGAADDAYTVNQGAVLTVPAGGVLSNDSDVDGDGLTAVLVAQPAHGTVTLNADGAFVYTPDPTFHGADSFTYQAFDGSAKSAVATARINIRPVQPPPPVKPTIAGVVINALTGQVISGAIVEVTADFDANDSADFAQSVTTGADGRYAIEVPKGGWTYTAKVTAPIPTATGTVSVTTTQTTAVPDSDKSATYQAEKKIAGQVLLALQPGVQPMRPDQVLTAGTEVTATLFSGDLDITGGPVTVHPDGLFEVSGVAPGNHRIVLSVRAPDGTTLTGITMTATVTGDGELLVGSVLVAPGGHIIDAVSKQPVPGAKVTLYWADTELNKQKGRTPDTSVALPTLPDFMPGGNAVPQLSAAGGTYAWLVHPDGDYYIVAEKAGYRTYDSRKYGILQVGNGVLKHDFQMEPVHRRYILGYPDGTFKPEQSITRAEIAAIFARIIQPTPIDLPAPPFGDVPASHWAATYIEVVRQQGLMLGDPNGNFRPDAPITRAELATIVSRFSSLALDAPNPFTDTVGHWAEAGISSAYRSGLVTGYPDGTFHPEAFTSRAEAATMINRMLGRGPLEGRSAPTWPDVPFDHWASGHVEEASSSHSATRGTEAHEHWTGDTGEETW